MQFINVQYKVLKISNEDKYGNLLVVEDTIRRNYLKYMRVINYQKETQDFIEYMKCNLYDYRCFNHPNLAEIFFFNKITAIDVKSIVANKYYLTYEYVTGENLFDYIKGKDFNTLLDLAVQLCSAIKYLHLRGYLMCNININELFVVQNNTLKITSLPYIEGTDKAVMYDKDNNYFKSPEAFQYGTFTRQSDIYLIGVIMFYLFSKENVENSNFREALAQFEPGKDANLCKVKCIIKKCTELKPQDRYGTVEEIVKDINEKFDKNYKVVDKKIIQTLPKYVTKLVSREKHLKTAINSVKSRLYEGRPVKLTILKGAMGTGKTVFLDTLNYRLQQEGITSIFHRLKEDISYSFSLITSVIKELIKRLDKELLDRYTIDLSYIMPEVLGSAEADIRNGVLKQEDKVRLIYRLGNFLLEASSRHPFAILVNGFEWIDEDSLEVLSYITRSEGKGNIYVVAGMDYQNSEENKKFRNLYNTLVDLGYLDTIELNNFNIDETAEYIRLLLGMDEPPMDFAANIFKETEGNPNYTYELMYLLFINNYIYVNDDGEWVLNHVDFSNINLSFNIDEIILNKINKLTPTQDEIIRVISIFNTAASSDILEAMLDIRGEELFNLLNNLVAINILSKKVDDWGITFDFSSISLKKSIYDKISQEDKQKYHKKASYVLESKFIRENRENKDELVYHMTKANRYDEAINLLMSSAEKMISNNLINQAIQFFEQTYSLFQKDILCCKKITVCSKLGNLYEQIGEYGKAMGFYDIVEDIAQKLQDNKVIIDIYIKKSVLLYKLHDRKGSVDYTCKAKRLLKKTDYPEGLFELIISLGDIMFFSRRYNTYMKILEKVIDYTWDVEAYKTYYARFLIPYGRMLKHKNRCEEGLNILLESVSILEEIGDYKDVPIALNNIGTIYTDYFNDLHKSREYYEKNLSISQKTNNLSIMEKSYNNLAEAYRLEDKHKETIEYYNKALDLVRTSKNIVLKTILSINCIMVYTAMEDYKKAVEYLNEAENLFNNYKDTNSFLPYFYEDKAEFYYVMGYFDLAQEYAQKATNTRISWGLSDFSKDIYMGILSDITINNTLGFQREMGFCLDAFSQNQYKFGRVACSKFAEIYIERGIKEKAREFLDLGLSYVHKIDTDILKLEYEYLYALISEEDIRLSKLMNLSTLMEPIEVHEIKWKIYNAVAQQLYRQKNYHEALKYLISALNLLRKLVHNVPDEYKVRFIQSHGRNSIKESLLKISELLTAKGGGGGGRQFLPKESGELTLQNIDKYFDYTDFREIYRRKEFDANGTHFAVDSNAYNKFLFRIQELINKFTEDNAANLKNMVNLFAEITQSKNAFIATLGEDDSLNILSSYNRYFEIPFYKYIIEQVKQKRDSIIITDAFEYNRKKGDILIPKDITAVFCIPIMISEDAGVEILEEKRKNKDQDGDAIIGYIYLDTDSIINNFTKESSHFCTLAAKIAYVLVDNYNLKIVSTVDKLTKLFTRKYFESALQNEMAYVEKEGGEFSLIMIDIDKFKSVNDRFGHQKGDEILQNVSSIIMSTVRKGDVCARYGGEEIIVMLPATDARGGYHVSEKIRKKVENAKLLGLNTPLTISLGVASYPEHSTFSKDLMEKADQALYHAKESGRNQSRIYQPNMSKTVKRIDKLAGIISGNLVEDQRKVETMLEILELQRNADMRFYDKVFNFLGRIIEVSEAQTGIVFLVDDKKNIVENVARKKLVDIAVQDAYYNEGLVKRCVENQNGEYLIDWGNYPGIDAVTGMPDWQSIIMVPITNNGIMKGLLYLSVSVKSKEFEANAFNFIKTLCDIISIIF